MDQPALDAAICKVIAGEIISKLDTSCKEEFLCRSMTDALTTYDFKHSVKDAVVKRVTEISAELVGTEAWTQQITAKVREGFELYLAQLPRAIACTLQEALNGSPGSSYSSSQSGIIRKYLNLEEKGK